MNNDYSFVVVLLADMIYWSCAAHSARRLAATRPRHGARCPIPQTFDLVEPFYIIFPKYTYFVILN